MSYNENQSFFHLDINIDDKLFFSHKLISWNDLHTKYNNTKDALRKNELHIWLATYMK